MYKSILVPVDPAHPDAGRRLLALARAIGGPEAKITALSAVEPIPNYVATELPEGLLARNAASAKARLAEMASGFGADSEVEIGHAWRAILDHAHGNGFELIAMASHRPGLQDVFLGSTAARVVRHAQCAVLVDR